MAFFLFHTVFFLNDTATTEIYTLSLHDALPIYQADARAQAEGQGLHARLAGRGCSSEEHTSELQSRQYLVCRLLLAKKKTTRPAACRSCGILAASARAGGSLDRRALS